MSEDLMRQIRLDLGKRAAAIVFVDPGDLCTIVGYSSGVFVRLGNRHLVATCGHALPDHVKTPIVLWHGQKDVVTLNPPDGRGLRFDRPTYPERTNRLIGRVRWHPDSLSEESGKLDLGLVEICDPETVLQCGTVFHDLDGGVCEHIVLGQELRVLGWPAEMLNKERSGRHSMAVFETVIKSVFEAEPDRFTMAFRDFEPIGTRTTSDGKAWRDFMLTDLPHPGGMSGGGVWALINEGPTEEGVWLPNRYRLAGIQFAAKHNHYLVAMKIRKWLDWALEETSGWR